MKKSYVENRKGLKVAKFTSLLRIHALLSRRGYLHIPNVFGSQGGCACSTTYHLVFKDWWTPRLVACTVLASHTAEWLQRGGTMQARTLHPWIARHIAVRTRLVQVGVSYLLFLMVVTRKHSLEEAARFSGLPKSQFSKFLHTPPSRHHDLTAPLHTASETMVQDA